MDRVSRLSFALVCVHVVAAGAVRAAECTVQQTTYSNAGGIVAQGYSDAAACAAWGALSVTDLKTACGLGGPVSTWEKNGSAELASGGALCLQPMKQGSFTTDCIGSRNLATVPCPPPEECSGSAAEGVGDEFTTLVDPGADGYCNAVSHCAMSVSSSVGVDGTQIFKVTHTDQECVHGAVPAPGPGDVTEGETCVTSASGMEFCLEPQGENCGYVNNNFTCLGSVEPDGCAVFPDGGRVCGAAAPTPPVPDSGTAGQPAMPDESVQATNGSVTNVFNFFDSTTVNNSSRPPGNSGDNPYDGEDDGNGTGGDGTEEEGEGTASGGETCAAAPVCDGDAIACAILAQEWKARCPEAVTEAQAKGVTGDHETIPSEELDMSTALSETLVSAGGGECPSPPVINLPVFGSVTITVITWFCALAAKIAVLVMMSAYVAAAFIVAGRM